jgi:hypothetical protein
MAETLTTVSLQTLAGPLLFYAVFDGTAYVLCSQSFIGGAPVTLANPLLVNSKPLPFNVITLNASQIVTPTQDPNGFFVNQAGTAATAQSGSTFYYGPNEPCTLVPSNGAVSVNSAGTAVNIQGYGLT